MNAKQTRLLAALLEESTITKAAERAGMTRATVYKYLKDPEFKAELDRRRGECVNDAVRYLQSKFAVCNETLIKIIESKDVSSQVKINAINAVYANCKNMSETADFMSRLEAAERTIYSGANREG